MDYIFSSIVIVCFQQNDLTQSSGSSLAPVRPMELFSFQQNDLTQSSGSEEYRKHWSYVERHQFPTKRLDPVVGKFTR
jgi:hypothetical protein